MSNITDGVSKMSWQREGWIEGKHDPDSRDPPLGDRARLRLDPLLGDRVWLRNYPSGAQAQVFEVPVYQGITWIGKACFLGNAWTASGKADPDSAAIEAEDMVPALMASMYKRL